MSKPKPIRDDPTQGHYQVVVSFRMETTDPKDGDPDLIEAFVKNRLGNRKDLDIAVRVIGAGGERSEMEGQASFGLTENDVPRFAHDADTITPRDGML